MVRFALTHSKGGRDAAGRGQVRHCSRTPTGSRTHRPAMRSELWMPPPSLPSRSPQLTVLDSTGTVVTTLDALPKHDGVDQRSFHCLSNFPLSVVPPSWFPSGGMPNVAFSAPR